MEQGESRFQLDPEVQKQLKETIQSVHQKLHALSIPNNTDYLQAFQKQLQNMAWPSLLLERQMSGVWQQAMQRIQQQLQSMTIPDLYTQIQSSLQWVPNILPRFDWRELSETIEKRLKEWDVFLQRYDSELWAIDEDLLEHLWDNSYDEEFLKTFSVKGYVEEKLDDYMVFFKAENLYTKHLPIIQQSYDAYREGKYALAIFPLLATADYVVASKFNEYVVTDPPKRMERKMKQTYHKVRHFVESAEDQLAVSFTLYLHVLNVYTTIFVLESEAKPNDINRHRIMHGRGNYDGITKVDVLKMFQFLKASSVVSEIPLHADTSATGA